MKIKITDFIKNWLIFTFKWVIILAFSMPAMSLFIGILSQLFPTYEDFGKQLLSLNSVIKYLIKGAEMGFLAGITFGLFYLMPGLGYKDNKH